MPAGDLPRQSPLGLLHGRPRSQPSHTRGQGHNETAGNDGGKHLGHYRQLLPSTGGSSAGAMARRIKIREQIIDNQRDYCRNGTQSGFTGFSAGEVSGGGEGEANPEDAETDKRQRAGMVEIGGAGAEERGVQQRQSNDQNQVGTDSNNSAPFSGRHHGEFTSPDDQSLE